jgi:hypothetical protein
MNRQLQPMNTARIRPRNRKPCNLSFGMNAGAWAKPVFINPR